jgi:acyl-homoserine-lactone acylase
MLLANPHLPWGDLFLFWESHLVGPTTDVYGATLVGVPGVAIGFNDHLGWTHTVNTYDGADLFVVARDGDGYRFGDEVRPFETRQEVVRIRDDDGTLRDDTLIVRATVHGPVIAEDAERAVALRVAGLDRGGALEEWWVMGKAKSLPEFERAMASLQIPMFNVLYADRDGHVLYLFNGVVPRRSSGDVRTWRGVVDGGDPSTLWTEYLDYAELPRIEDPAVGWLQNANDPPWTSTIPQALDPAAFPSWLAPRFLAMRPQRSAGMLLADTSISFEELSTYKHATRMEAADRLLDDLLAAARASADPDARRAADVLEAWDRTADADSRGGVLFLAWLDRLQEEGGGWATPWSPEAPVTTPDGLADPAAAMRLLGAVTREVEARWGAADVRWGDVHRARVGSYEVEASGAGGDPGGVFRVADYEEDGDGRRWVSMGDSYYALLAFGPDGVEARVLLAYGNASQPGSPHIGDQLELYGQKRMRMPWRVRSDIEANLESRTDLSTTEEGR